MYTHKLLIFIQLTQHLNAKKDFFYYFAVCKKKVTAQSEMDGKVTTKKVFFSVQGTQKNNIIK
jgi:hypothetical protein